MLSSSDFKISVLSIVGIFLKFNPLCLRLVHSPSSVEGVAVARLTGYSEVD